MNTYLVSGKVLVEVTDSIEAENKEEALKAMNERMLFFDSSKYNEAFSDDTIIWNYAEKLMKEND